MINKNLNLNNIVKFKKNNNFYFNKIKIIIKKNI